MVHILESSTLIAKFHSRDDVRCPSSISEGGGGGSAVIKSTVSSRNIAQCLHEPGLAVRGTTVRQRVTTLYYMTLNYHPRRALRHQDKHSDAQKEAVSLQEHRNVLQAWLNSWFKIQAVYIPVAQTLRANERSDDTGASGYDEDYEDVSRLPTVIVPEKAKLLLPSQIPPSFWSTGCVLGLRDIELKMRITQASDALEQLKQELCVYSGLVHYKITQVSGPGQKANMRALNLLVRFRTKFTRCAERYRAARAALEVLDPTGDWQDYFRPLSDSDIQGPNGKSPKDGVAGNSKASKRLRGAGEGVRQLSWIWRVQHTAKSERTRVPSEADLDKCESLSFRDPLR